MILRVYTLNLKVVSLKKGLLSANNCYQLASVYNAEQSIFTKPNCLCSVQL